MKYWFVGGILSFALVAWAGFAVYGRTGPVEVKESIPTTVVQRGDVRFSVVAKGNLQGKSTRMLMVPMAAKGELVITALGQQGELVHAGDVVAEFDATELVFDLREATADLEEARERLRQARAEADAKKEEALYALAKAGSDVTLAELECRRNSLVSAIVAQQNDLALEAARDRLRQLQTDLASRQAAAEAGVAIQQAAVSKAEVKAEIATKAIESMTLRAPADGYVSIMENRNSNGFMFAGMELPLFQLGDTVRPGVPIMQIPNLEDWQISAQIGELDRGHLAVGQEAEIGIIAAPGKTFRGRITNIGSTTGPPWNRRFECSISIDDPSAELRPGMSAMVEIVTAELKDVLWLPSQAVFDRGGQPFVYLRQSNGFAPVDVTLTRSGGARVAVEGIEEGSVAALADPTQLSPGEIGTNAAGALPGQ